MHAMMSSSCVVTSLTSWEEVVGVLYEQLDDSALRRCRQHARPETRMRIASIVKRDIFTSKRAIHVHICAAAVIHLYRSVSGFR